MALHTLGTTSSTAIAKAFKWTPGLNSIASADMASLANAILNDQVSSGISQIWQEGFAFNGILNIPNRGILQVLPGDCIAVDSSGWPILVSKASLAAGGTNWTFT